MPENKTSAAGRDAPIKETGPRGANAPPEPTEAPEKPGAAALAALCADTSDYRRAATDLEYFGKYYLPHYFSLPAPPFHRALDALWRERVMDGADPVRDAARILSKTGTRTAVAAPRGHAKSTVMSLKNALHAALYGYKRYILLVSDTETQAVGFLDAIKTELEENERILRDFGEQPGKKTWKTSSIQLANGCRIDAVGSGQKLRGRRNYERRPDLILCDDIENDEGVRTLEQRDKLAAWFYKAVCKSGDRYTDILMIGTVLHHDALLARVLKNPGFQSRIYRAILSDSASPLWEDWEALYTDLADPKRERTAHAFFYRHRKEMLTGARVLWPEKLSYYDLRVMRLVEGESACCAAKRAAATRSSARRRTSSNGSSRSSSPARAPRRACTCPFRASARRRTRRSASNRSSRTSATATFSSAATKRCCFSSSPSSPWARTTTAPTRSRARAASRAAPPPPSTSPDCACSRGDPLTGQNSHETDPKP